jgi:predicted site-specific integrase-resolvase
MNPPDTEPMMSLDKFIEQTGLSAVTLWRYRKKGMLTTVNICGRQYILRSEIGRFNKRAAAGEFAKPPNPPGKSILLPRVSARTARVQ